MSATAFPSWLDAAWRGLVERRNGARLPHALLIAGPAGLGKRALSERLVAALLCQHPDGSGDACGHCRGCTLRAAGSHPDLVNVRIAEDSKQILIEQVRGACERMALTSHFGGLKITTIAPAEAMNVAAANALLKTLEEPTGDALLVLVSDQPAQLLATIRSRCQRIDVRPPEPDEARAWLAAQGVASDVLPRALALASNNPGQALALADPKCQEQAAEVARHLLAVARGAASPSAVAAGWVKDEAERRVALACAWVHLAAWQVRGESRLDLDPELTRLTAAIDFHKLSRWWDDGQRLRQQLATPLRADLIVGEWLYRWQGMGQTATRGM